VDYRIFFVSSKQFVALMRTWVEAEASNLDKLLAVLCMAVLCMAVLCMAVLCMAVLCMAVLCMAVLCMPV
jgi:uncharacterized membrane protein YbaN (DUF454 family)